MRDLKLRYPVLNNISLTLPKDPNTVGARKIDTLRNKLKQTQFFHRFIIIFFSSYAYDIKRAYI